MSRSPNQNRLHTPARRAALWVVLQLTLNSSSSLPCNAHEKPRGTARNAACGAHSAGKTRAHPRSRTHSARNPHVNIKFLYCAPNFFKMACKQNPDVRCVLGPVGPSTLPSTLGAGAKTCFHTPKAVTYHAQPHYCMFMIGRSLWRMESRTKKCKPHCVCVCRPGSGNARTAPKHCIGLYKPYDTNTLPL